jgi:uncharacterized protein YbbK (DUF523 family)
MGRRRSKIRIGISSCLLGQKVRFDGGHKRDACIADRLGRFVTFVPVCPEVEIGLGTPRETLRLVRRGGETRLVTTHTGIDHTEKMLRYAARKVRDLAARDLSGFVLKKDSPSCGLQRVKVYKPRGIPSSSGRGMFAARLLARFPLLPVEEEGRLQTPRLRENFLERVFAYRRLRNFFSRPWTVGDLLRFHTTEKPLILAHDPAACAKLDQLVARARSAKRKEFAEQYQPMYTAALRFRTAGPTTHRPTKALRRLAGQFKWLLGS